MSTSLQTLLLVLVMITVVAVEGQQMVTGCHNKDGVMYGMRYPNINKPVSTLAISARAIVQPRSNVLVWIPYDDSRQLSINKFDPFSMTLIGEPFNITLALDSHNCESGYRLHTVPGSPSIVVVPVDCQVSTTNSMAHGSLTVDIDTLQQRMVLVPELPGLGTEYPLCMADDSHAIYHTYPNVILLSDLLDSGKVLANISFPGDHVVVYAAAVSLQHELFVEVETNYADAMVYHCLITQDYTITSCSFYSHIAWGQSSIMDLQIDRDHNLFASWWDREISCFSSFVIFPSNMTLPSARLTLGPQCVSTIAVPIN